MPVRTRAEELIHALEKLTVEKCASPQDFVRQRQELQKNLAAWGALHPEEFLPIFTDDNAGPIGKWICGSGARGARLLHDLIFNGEFSQRTAALRAF